VNTLAEKVTVVNPPQICRYLAIFLSRREWSGTPTESCGVTF